MNQSDIAETGRLAEVIKELLPALEKFNRFESQDRAGLDCAVWKTTLSHPLPQRGAGLAPVLRRLADTVIPNGLRNGSPGFSGWVTTAPTTAGTAAALAATVAGSQRFWVQSFNFLETVALRWLAELLDIPSDMQGTFVSGGSVANLIGLGAARQRAFERLNHDAARDGLPPTIRWRIYASSEVHHVVTRAAAVLGLGRRAVTSIAVDAAQRLDLNDLQKTLRADRAAGILPVAIVATAGTVNTGAIDPIEQMAEIAAEYKTWLHVDGAYGLFGKLDPRVAHLYRGLERADSIAVDPHKWLAAPVGCGAAFVRDRALLGRTFTLEPAEYLEGAASTGEVQSSFDNFGELYHNFNVDQSAPSRGVQVWAILQEIGAEGMRERVIRHNNFARHLAARVERDDRLELLAKPTLSICCFRYRVPQMDESGLNALNAEIARHLRAESKYVPSTTLVAGKFAIRPCYINPRTTLTEVDGLADRVREIGDELTSRGFNAMRKAA
jgi:glutamate/tyrosine decarboxylase-like PLP-dependent enzyme